MPLDLPQVIKLKVIRRKPKHDSSEISEKFVTKVCHGDLVTRKYLCVINEYVFGIGIGSFI